MKITYTGSYEQNTDERFKQKNKTTYNMENNKNYQKTIKSIILYNDDYSFFHLTAPVSFTHFP